MSGARSPALRLPRPAVTTANALTAALVGIGSVALIVLLFTDVPEAWRWITITAMATVPVVVWHAANGRLFEPLPLLAASCALLFLTRPIQLLLEWRDLYSHFFPADPIRHIVLLETQEVAFYVTERIDGPIGPPLARATAICAIFTVAMLAGYRFGRVGWIERRLEGLTGRGAPRNAVAAIAGALAIGIAAQAVIVARAGGPTASIETANDQNALSDSFALYFLAGFALMALVVWVAWHRPRSRAEWAGLVLAIAAVCGFAMIAGSRARVFVTLLVLAFVVHHLHRRWRWRELVAVGLLLLAFASSFGVFRQLTSIYSIGKSASLASEHVLDWRVIANDTTSFDHLLYAVTTYGVKRPHEHGRFLLDGARSYLPGVIDPNKPEGGDIVFRKVIWGDQFGAGRPPTAAGDFFIDFALPGVAVGGFLVGMAAWALLGLIRGGPEGRPYRVALFAVLVVILYEFVVGTLSIALGFAITMLIPLLLTLHGLGRLPWPRARLGSGP
jgi:oligosaccharide repeat unit polymerase